MCGRFWLPARLDAIENYTDAKFPIDYEPRYIVPEEAGISTIQNASRNEINQLRWGFLAWMG